MNLSLDIGTYFGIPVRIHWTFGFIILFLLYISRAEGLDASETFWLGAYMFALFVCVIFHEYGHALTARLYNVKTRDIILTPIGGLARLESLPQRPWQEFAVAIAGPLVNIVIACLIAIGIVAAGEDFLPETDSLIIVAHPLGFIQMVFWMNLALFSFNLIPAFPMDGGRILRALLSLWTSRLRATQVAVIVGRLLAIAFVIVGFYFSHFALALIGLFVYVMAGAELRQTRLRSLLESTAIENVLRHDFTRVLPGDTLETVVHKVLEDSEHNFLVFDQNGNVIGCVPEYFIMDVIKEKNQFAPVAGYMSQSWKVFEVGSLQNLFELYSKMISDHLTIVGITEGSDIIGVIDRNAIQNIIRMSSKSKLF